MALAFTDDLELIVRPEKKKKWDKQRHKIFVMDESDPRDLRRPGKFKQEFTTSNGGIIM